MLIASPLIERIHVHIAPPIGPLWRWRRPRFERYGSHTRVSPRSGRAVCSSAVELAPLAVRSIDVEFAHFVTKGQVVTAAAEVCLLSADGSVLLSSFISPELTAEQSDPIWIGGVTVENCQFAAPLKTVRNQLSALLKGSLLIGYGLSKDLTSLQLHHPESLQKDLIKYQKFQSPGGQARKLQDVTRQYLKYEIQAGRHTAREDALAALQLYMLHIRDDPALMTYQELVDFELRNLPITSGEGHG